MNRRNVAFALVRAGGLRATAFVGKHSRDLGLVAATATGRTQHSGAAIDDCRFVLHVPGAAFARGPGLLGA